MKVAVTMILYSIYYFVASQVQDEGNTQDLPVSAIHVDVRSGQGLASSQRLDSPE